MFLEIKNILMAPSMAPVNFLTKYQNIPVIIHLVTRFIFTQPYLGKNCM